MDIIKCEKKKVKKLCHATKNVLLTLAKKSSLLLTEEQDSSKMSAMLESVSLLKEISLSSLPTL